MVTVAIGPYQQAQGDLVALEGSQAQIRIGNRLVRGTLITDLAKRPDLAQLPRAYAA